jgi:hypothetical protein
MQGILVLLAGCFNQELGSSAANLAQYAPLNAKGGVYAQNGIQAICPWRHRQRTHAVPLR